MWHRFYSYEVHNSPYYSHHAILFKHNTGFVLEHVNIDTINMQKTFTNMTLWLDDGSVDKAW